MDLKRFEIRISRSENLPMLPQVVSEVLQSINKDSPSIRNLEEIIETDTAVAAKILKAANSSYYGTGGHCTTLNNAISILGYNTVRTLMISVAYYQLTSTAQLSENFSKEELWQHSVAVATCSGILAKILLPLETEELYVAGLMHDVGYLMMDMFAPRDLDKAVKTARFEAKQIHEIEESTLGWSHTDAGAMLADKWSLPPIISAVINYHHKPVMAKEYLTAVCIVSLADSIAHQCSFTNNSIGVARAVDPFVMETLEIPEEQVEITKELLVAEVIKAQESFKIGA